MKKYVFEVVIEEGNDEYWESLVDTNSTGCDEMREMIVEAFNGTGLIDAVVKLKEFTDKD